ncbi:MAG: U32 family peptidase [Eubacteriales bacterium]|nr:U32 family peptidase [Eubacteriales bacterium]
MIQNIELLAPAGNLSNLKTAMHFGADAVYGALKQFGLRAFAGNFSYEELAEALEIVHNKGKKFYLTLNAMPHDNAMDNLLELAKKAFEMGVDAAIVSDIGVMHALHSNIPALPLHISTQANTLNSSACNFYHSTFGAERIILARELSLSQIAEIRKNIPAELALESFVHGAMCMAYSGRCLLSNALTGRDGNQGACTQSCRWKYSLVESQRPGEAMPIYEDEHGSYILSSFDLCMLDHLPDLCKSGLNSLKIEGRMKSEYYVATVISAYRRALDALAINEETYYNLLPSLLEELDKVSHRASNTGFYYGAPSSVAGAQGVMQSMEFKAHIIENGEANTETKVLLKNRFHVGDVLEVLSPTGYQSFTCDFMRLGKNMEETDTYGVANEVVYLKFPFAVNEGDIVRGALRTAK